MRRPISWFAVSITLPFLFAIVLLGSCGGGEVEDGDGTEPPAVSGMLRKVRSPAELEESLKSSLLNTLLAGPPSGPIFTAATGGGDFSQTYTAEAGVDEFDYARYDGTHLYIAPPRFASNAAPDDLRILKTNPANGSASQVSSIPIEADRRVLGIYVAAGRLVLMTSNSNSGPGPRAPFGGVWLTIAYWEPSELKIQVFDVNDPAHPTEILSGELDGIFVESRRVGDRVYLVTRHTPSVLLQPDARSRLQRLELEDLLPKYRSAGRTRALVEASDCYITNDTNNVGYPILTTITSFSMQNPADLVGTCYNESSSGVYASTTALYVSQQEFGSSVGSTRIHKFSFNGAAPAYAGSVQVPGSVWTGGQRDFRMNEYQGLLRVMTTENKNDPADWPDHSLFVLRPKANELALEVISKLPNDARPEEIGKPNEQLFGVRFAGDRAYVITFEQVDPLYVLDLANPADPRIAGQLELPGFSDFLHPVTQNLLLGIGMQGRNTKLELFDVSVLEQPQSRGSIVLEGWTAGSEALNDRHAFAYLPADAADRLAIPATVVPDPAIGGWFQTSLYQFEVAGKQSAASASLQRAGVVTPQFANDAERFALTSRSFIHGDSVYYIHDGKVFSTSWFAPSQVQGPF